MQWRDQGIILTLRKYGEFDAILEVLTRDHGLCCGIVKGGLGRRQRGNIQPGNEIDVTWRGRLSSHLGLYNVEVKNARSVAFLYTPSKLAALNSVTAVLSVALPENEVHSLLLDGLLAFLDTLNLAQDNILNWGPLLVRFELGLLQELGFGLNLGSCVASGQQDELIYVSPKSGRAVSKEAGLPYHDKMLTLPMFLTETGHDVTIEDIRCGFALTEFFMDRHMLRPFAKKIPQARRMIMDYII